MEQKIMSTAGTLESSDIMITLEITEQEEGIQIELSSTVEKQFGREIRRVITETLEELHVTGARMKAVDRGALNCTIRARVRTAVARCGGAPVQPWKGGCAQ